MLTATKAGHTAHDKDRDKQSGLTSHSIKQNLTNNLNCSSNHDMKTEYICVPNSSLNAQYITDTSNHSPGSGNVGPSASKALDRAVGHIAMKLTGDIHGPKRMNPDVFWCIWPFFFWIIISKTHKGWARFTHCELSDVLLVLNDVNRLDRTYWTDVGKLSTYEFQK